MVDPNLESEHRRAVNHPVGTGAARALRVLRGLSRLCNPIRRTNDESVTHFIYDGQSVLMLIIDRLAARWMRDRVCCRTRMMRTTRTWHSRRATPCGRCEHVSAHVPRLFAHAEQRAIAIRRDARS